MVIEMIKFLDPAHFAWQEMDLNEWFPFTVSFSSDHHHLRMCTVPDKTYSGVQRKGPGTSIGSSRELYLFVFFFSLTRRLDNLVGFSLVAGESCEVSSLVLLLSGKI